MKSDQSSYKKSYKVIIKESEGRRLQETWKRVLARLPQSSGGKPSSGRVPAGLAAAGARCGRRYRKPEGNHGLASRRRRSRPLPSPAQARAASTPRRRLSSSRAAGRAATAPPQRWTAGPPRASRRRRPLPTASSPASHAGGGGPSQLGASAVTRATAARPSHPLPLPCPLFSSRLRWRLGLPPRQLHFFSSLLPSLFP